MDSSGERQAVRCMSVKFDPVGRTRTFLLPEVDFDPEPKPGDQVVVQMGARRTLGTMVPKIPPIAERTAPPPGSPLRVVRRATREDVLRRFRQEQREREARRICLLKIRERGLQMKLVKVEQMFDDSKLIFSFTAEGRVDFRGLVRELASEFKARIEMRQIGARDEAKVLGGYGTCGRPLCCTTWLQSLRADLHQDGQAPEPEPEPVAPVRGLRPAEVLPAVRAPQRQRRAARGMRPRIELQPERRRVPERGWRRLCVGWVRCVWQPRLTARRGVRSGRVSA